MNFHEKLNEYIQMLSCTAKELSELSGLSAATLSRYRSGERVPDMRSSTFSQLCSAIARISEQKGNSTLTADAVRKSFLSCEDLVTVDREQLRYNFNTLIPLLNINISRYASTRTTIPPPFSVSAAAPARLQSRKNLLL